MVYFKVSNSILSGAAMMVYSFANHFTPLCRRGHINPRQGISGTFEGILTPEGILTYTKEYEGILPLFSYIKFLTLRHSIFRSMKETRCRFETTEGRRKGNEKRNEKRNEATKTEVEQRRRNTGRDKTKQRRLLNGT